MGLAIFEGVPMVYLRLLKAGVILIGLVWLTIFAISLVQAQTITGTITVEACEDQDGDGECGPGGPLPAGMLACLENQSRQVTCQTAPVTFTNLALGVYTATLQFSGASQGYYPTTPPVRVTLAGCSCNGCQCSGPGCTCQCECQCRAAVRLGALYPVHPKGVAVHTGLNKVYVAFQGPKINNDRPYPFVAVIDSASDRVIRTLPGGANGVTPAGTSGIGREPWGVAVSGDNQYVYVGSFGDGLISVINPIFDTVITNLKPSAPFSPTAPAVNPITGHVHFPDYRGQRVVVISGTNIMASPMVASGGASSPFEMVVANTLNGYNFVTLRDAVNVPFQFRSFNSPTAGNPSPPISPHPLPVSGSPHAIGLWQKAGMSGNPRLFLTYAENLVNPNKLLIYSFSPTNPGVVTPQGGPISLGRSFAEVGLIYHSGANRMLGTYGGFLYVGDNGDTTACNSSIRGGTYALDFEGRVLGQADGADTETVWRLPKTVVGNPPLTDSSLEWRNPFELALNSNNGKVYVTDRCWVDFLGGGKSGGGGVLIFTDGVTGSPSGAYLPVVAKAEGDE